MATSSITEMGVTFYKAGGHNHDGVTSTLIDASKYSIFDFNLEVGTSGSDVNRETSRQSNRNRFDQYISRLVTTQVLAPAGIVLPVDSVRGVNIGANEITAQNIQTNTITADLLVTDFAVVNSTIRSNNFQYDANTGTGAGWAIYGNGTSIFVDGVFSGEIDVGGFDNTSFHVDINGNVWSGSASYIDAPFSISSTGDTLLANGKFTANTNGDISITGNLTVNSSIIRFEPIGEVGSAYLIVAGGVNVSQTLYAGAVATYQGDISAYQGNFFISGTAGNYLTLEASGFLADQEGATKLKLRRTAVSTSNTSYPSHMDNQMIQLWNSAESSSTGNGVCGISFAVGTSTVVGAVIRAWPAGGAGSPALYNNAGVIDEGVWTQASGVDVGTLGGTAYAFVGASAFVVRSSSVWKENIEYMPQKDRNISVERIKNLKPARWDDKDGFQMGYLSDRFKNINEKWVASGKSSLIPQSNHYEFRVHNCEIDECIGDKESPCPDKKWHEKRYGFIAEDVAKAFPRATQFDAVGNPIGIDYAVITYGLVETTQHLLDKIDELESKIAELTA